MLVLQGFPVCNSRPLTDEQLMNAQRRRIGIHKATQAKKAEKRATGKIWKSNASPTRL